ncbi:MAG: TetR/AcrR family transcriptional regulator [Bacteroidales bacterium]
MNERKEYIKTITNGFLKYGIKSMSMDDIARLLGMSKKTLYQHFKDKNEIVVESISYIKELIEQEFCYRTNSKRSYIEREVKHAKRVIEGNKFIKATFIFDLKKFYPAELAELSSYKNKLIYKSCCAHIKSGQEQGFVREEIDPEFIAKLCVTMTNAVITSDISEFSEEDLVSGKHIIDFLDYNLHAVCTPKGIDEYNKIRKKNKI